MSNIKTKEEREQYWKLLVSILKKESEVQGKKPYHISQEVNMSPSTIQRTFDLKFCPRFEIVLAIMESLNFSFSDLHNKIKEYE